MMDEVIFLNPRTCGLYKEGGPKYKIDPQTGRRTNELDDELNEHVDLFLSGLTPPGLARVPANQVFERQVLVPRYYDQRWIESYQTLLAENGLKSITLGELEDKGWVLVRGGHGSAPNDVRQGEIPYIKVSDLRALRVNVNPTNMVPRVVAERLWRGGSSGLEAWDLLTPGRASANIGEFVVLLPGEEEAVVTQEVILIRALEAATAHGLDPFYLLWALSLRGVREQWRRLVLMQTNREDVGERYREISLPLPKTPEWGLHVSRPFRDYFTQLAQAKADFQDRLGESGFSYVAAARLQLAAASGEALEHQAIMSAQTDK